MLCNPPKPGDPSYELFEKERSDEFASLQRRAKLVSDAFNSLPNMSVVPTAAAMYAFPEVHMPPGAIAAAEAAGKKPDVFYCLRWVGWWASAGGVAGGGGREDGLPSAWPKP